MLVKAPPKKTKTQPSADVMALAIVSVPLDKLHDHPANPTPDDADVQDTAGWLRERGQDEPLVVRPLESPIGHYEVLAGRRRLAAARRLGWDAIQCRVRQDLGDEKAAVAFMAASNAQRHAETPIRQALMLRAMFDAGLTLKQAGAIYGLASESAVRNKMQLLKLPEAWQQRVVSGEIPESAARCLAPYAEHAPLMEAIETAYQQDRQSEYAQDWTRRDEFEDAVASVIKEHTRPVDEGRYYQGLGWHERLFELTPQLERELQVVELPLGDNGKKVRVSLNCEAFDARQTALIEEKQAKQRSKAKAPKADAKAKPDEQLEKRIDRWRHAWLRTLIAQRVVVDRYSWVATKLALWCLSRHWGYHEHGQLAMDEIVAELAGVGSCRLHQAEETFLTKKVCTESVIAQLLAAAIVKPERRPELPVWPIGLLEQLGRDLDLDLVDQWSVLQSGSSGPRDRAGSARSLERPSLFAEFFELHTSEQLDELGGELGVYVMGAKTKASKVKMLTAAPRILPLPRCIQPLKVKP